MGDSSRALMAEAHGIALQMRQEEQSLLENRSSAAQREIRRTMIAGGLATVALAVLIVAFIARILRRTATTYEASLNEQAAQAAACSMQIAADAGVSLRTFYRHFTSKHDLLFADYDAGLHWFRGALAAARPAAEPRGDPRPSKYSAASSSWVRAAVMR